MATSPFVVDRFTGLNVFDDPQEAGASSAIDTLNADLDQRGRVRGRDGSTALTSAAANRQTAIAYFFDGSSLEQLVAVEGTTLVPYTLSTGAAVGATQAVLLAPSSNAFARFGDPSNTRLYVTMSSLFRWNGAAWATIGGAPVGVLAAVTANDNRLVISDGVHRVYFSDAGAPETFGANNYVDLWPGDGETIRAMVRWRDYLFVFKQTKFAVFTSTSTSSAGTPVFNYRSVDAGRGVYASGQAAAGEEGVYIADSTGIYLTTGDKPAYISQPIEPWLRAGSFGSLPSFTLASATLTYHDRRLYVVFPNTTSSTTLVYDPSLGAWMVWQMGAISAVSVPTSSQYRGLYFGEYTSKKITKLDSTVFTDQGAARSWQHTSAPYDLGFPGRVKCSLESRAWGYGSVSMQVANDYASFDTGSTLTLGTAPAVAEAWQQIDREGTLWQHKVSGTGQSGVSRLAHMVSFVKPPGLQ